MISVTRKDSKEPIENLLRRFSRKVIMTVKNGQYFEKPLSKRERRIKAIIRRERKAIKVKNLKMGKK
jgi:ribosomal protein S21